MAQFLKGNKAYYEMAAMLLKGSKVFRVYCKTPTIFMSSQRVTAEQKAFYETFKKELQRDIDVRYVFSLPYVQEDILQVAKKDKNEALSILKEWESVSMNPKIGLRFVEERNPFSFLVFDKKAVFLAVYPNKERGVIVFDNEEVPFFREFFDQAFLAASDNLKQARQEIKREIDSL